MSYFTWAVLASVLLPRGEAGKQTPGSKISGSLDQNVRGTGRNDSHH